MKVLSRYFVDSFSPFNTSPTLLGRLRDPAVNKEAWAEFVGRYGPLVYRWCMFQRLQEADAQDVTQTVLTKLVVRLREFEYDPSRSFRAYLKTVARRTWQDLIDDRYKPGAGAGGSSVLEQINGIAAEDCLAQQLEEEYDRELFDRASEHVRERVEPHTWEAFRLTAIGGLSGADTAKQLGLAVYVVFKARSKVQEMLRLEVAKLDGRESEQEVSKDGGP